MSKGLLDSIKGNKTLFFDAIPQIPQGSYVHFILIRETESFPVFQTDGTLNVIRVQGGTLREGIISRLILFKRKQSSPERLNGRELLRSVGILSDEGGRKCEYNSENFCKSCPDCILYGFAIGSEGAEKSKVYVDSAFSITPYTQSHKAFSFNALYEHGTMTNEGKTRASFGELDHVVPQVFFPSVVTLRDPTYEGFLYLLGNILRIDRYGAQDTRTGKICNHLVAIAFTNGEIYSNLRYTQSIYDALCDSGELGELLERSLVLSTANDTYKQLIEDEPVVVRQEFIGTTLQALVREVILLYQSEQATKDMLKSLDKTTREYAMSYGANKKAEKKTK